MDINTYSKSTAYLLVKLLLTVLCFVTTCHGQNRISAQRCGDKELVCHVIKKTTTYQLMNQQRLEVEESYVCQPVNIQDDMTYDLALSKDFVDANPDLYRGLTYIKIPGGCIQDSEVVYPPNATIALLPEPRRLRRRATKGTVTVLVVRATEKGYPELRSNDKIREMIFGNVTGSFARQMYDCSFGKYIVQKAQGPGINDGMLEVDLDIDVSDVQNRIVEINHLVPLLAPYGGEAAFDHVMYCIPYGTASGESRQWLAYALLNHPRSVFNHFWCGLLTATMHEAGHNLGLHHSSQDDWDYGDATGMMGYSQYEEFGPRLCFNAQKNWQLGWYRDRTIDLTSSIRNNSWEGGLVAFVDYNRTPKGDVVIIRVGNLYAQYNRARDFNKGSREYRNRVVIVSVSTTGSSLSKLEAALANNIAVSTFSYPNYDDSGYSLVFKVCNQVRGPPIDYVHLSIHLDNGIQFPACT